MKIWKISAKPRNYGLEDPDAGNYHDYQAEWDYDVVNRPRGKMMQAFIQAAQDIQSKHMEHFKDYFKRFTIQFVKDAGQGRGNALASYINGTSGEPVIVIDLIMCAKAQRQCRDVFTMYQTAITTLMHELKHAVQEYEDEDKEIIRPTMEDDPEYYQKLEDEAEEFGLKFI